MWAWEVWGRVSSYITLFAPAPAQHSIGVTRVDISNWGEFEIWRENIYFPGTQCKENHKKITGTPYTTGLSQFILFCCNVCCFDALFYAVLLQFLLLYSNSCGFVTILLQFTLFCRDDMIGAKNALSQALLRWFPGTFNFYWCLPPGCFIPRKERRLWRIMQRGKVHKKIRKIVAALIPTVMWSFRENSPFCTLQQTVLQSWFL